MSIQFGWGNAESDTLHVKLEGRWTWDEALEYARLCHDQVEASILPMYLIVEHRHAAWLPGGFNTNLANLLQYSHPNTHAVLVVTSSRLLIELLYGFNMLTEPLPFRFQIMDSVPAALQWIADYRVSNYIRQPR